MSHLDSRAFNSASNWQCRPPIHRWAALQKETILGADALRGSYCLTLVFESGDSLKSRFSRGFCRLKTAAEPSSPRLEGSQTSERAPVDPDWHVTCTFDSWIAGLLQRFDNSHHVVLSPELELGWVASLRLFSKAPQFLQDLLSTAWGF